jgi:hypothetical protein
VGLERRILTLQSSNYGDRFGRTAAVSRLSLAQNVIVCYFFEGPRCLLQTNTWFGAHTREPAPRLLTGCSARCWACAAGWCRWKTKLYQNLFSGESALRRSSKRRWEHGLYAGPDKWCVGMATFNAILTGRGHRNCWQSGQQTSWQSDGRYGKTTHTDQCWFPLHRMGGISGRSNKSCSAAAYCWVTISR